MKQARAYGVGVLLATQSPMDLDYRVLSNAGVWFVGRLQTDADRARVVEAMASAPSAGDPAEGGPSDSDFEPAVVADVVSPR
jgi:DNA helicase HerA-like ATPase